MFFLLKVTCALWQARHMLGTAPEPAFINSVPQDAIIIHYSIIHIHYSFFITSKSPRRSIRRGLSLISYYRRPAPPPREPPPPPIRPPEDRPPKEPPEDRPPKELPEERPMDPPKPPPREEPPPVPRRPAEEPPKRPPVRGCVGVRGCADVRGGGGGGMGRRSRTVGPKPQKVRRGRMTGAP